MGRLIAYLFAVGLVAMIAWTAAGMLAQFTDALADRTSERARVLEGAGR